ncbi:alpha/beta hydrolase [Saccharothrix violaceirubra]|uniref:Pimeloyl-ACP methyl ester carboxylesterase n=1 Tax=Saccharothrix violaceirubra TaxID=413306 RepID=A0A7W7SZP2_9PSEU|nr:alpha/beta hydrolase [Saccharothrix violaceirubra]MBB4963928.1 pimeloyl-ACP methyl ester carboxylesterase [Saccharothrix violaceirubra]
MRPTFRVLGGMATATALVLGMTTAADAAPETAFTPAAVDWKPCPELAEVECGTLRLPVDWAKPKGEKFDLALARRKATDPARRIGILVINPGGPGGSGVDFALGAPGLFSPEIQARFDIVGFDPRGVARSNPVKCSVEVLQRQVSVFPTSRQEFEALGRYNRERAADCRKHTGPIYDHADTGAVVDDIDAIRRSLGERKINYYGVSYGTLMGQQYAERYGRNLRAMVIDSNMDHSIGAWRFNEQQAATTEDSFREFAKWCERDRNCALHGRDVSKFWRDLLAKADRGEIPDPFDPERKLTSETLISNAFSAFYGPSWEALAEWLVALAEPGATVASAYAEPETVEFPFPAVFCQDYNFRVKTYAEFSALVARAKQVAPNMRGSMLGHYAVADCVGLTDRANNPQHRLRVENAPKILMLNAEHDPATGYDWAKAVHEQTRGTTVLLTYGGWGHGVYWRSDCTRGTTDDYLLSAKAPARDLRCAAVQPSPTVARKAASVTLPTGPAPTVPGWRR